MFGLFKKKYSEADQRSFLLKALSDLLAIQCGLGGKDSLEDANGQTNLKALGYICGFCDCALQMAFSRKSDQAKDYETTQQVLHALYGLKGGEYMRQAFEAMNNRNPDFNTGLMKGGREYLTWAKSAKGGETYMAIGLAGYLLGKE